MPTPQKTLGKKGESLAKDFLLQKGLRFIESNFHAQGGEIDLIFKEETQNIYVFVEVKTRRTKTFGNIKESINAAKIKKMMRAISAYFFKKRKYQEIPLFQIDAVFIQKEKEKWEIEHVENIGLEDF